MDSDALKEAFKQAAEIAKTVPEALQEAAFNRALDAILGETEVKGRPARIKKKGTSKRKQVKNPQKSGNNGDSSDNPYKFLTANMDRTAYPEISSAPRVLERSLWLLRVAKDDYDIDGIGPTHIAKILTEKFRLRTTYQAVQQALDSAREYVDRHSPQSGRVVYRIMHPGEVYLDSPDSKEGKSSSTTPKAKKSKSKKKKTAKKKVKAKKSVKKGASSRAKAQSSSTKGAAAIVTELLNEGFFNKARTIRNIVDHAKNDLGYNLKSSELSPPLLRALRSKKLKRTQNSDNQYEYSKA